MKDMIFNGKVTVILPLQTGTGRNGDWKKQPFIVETTSTTPPRPICFTLWGDKVDQYPLVPGEEVTIHFYLESREYQNKWYTDAKVIKILKSQSGEPSGSPSANEEPNDPLPFDDDLMFGSNPETEIPF